MDKIKFFVDCVHFYVNNVMLTGLYNMDKINIIPRCSFCIAVFILYIALAAFVAFNNKI